MTLRQLSVSGFRGAREHVTIRFGSGFTVITGRNGAGKSTVADAIEYAFSGSLSKYTDASENKETVNDYLWWRGESAPNERAVALEILNDDGSDVSIVRTPGKLVVNGEKDVRSIVSYPDRAPAECVQTWCRTSILRDEKITEFSIDLSETDRYGFVKNAIGTLADLPKVEAQLRAVLKELAARKTAVEKETEAAREKLRVLRSNLTAGRANVERSTDAAQAIRRLRSTFPDSPDDAALLTVTAERWLKAERLRVETLNRLLPRLSDAERRLQASSASADEIEKAQSASEAAQLRLRQVSEALEEAEKRWQSISMRQGGVHELAVLFEHGSRLGLRDNKCPLCASQLTPEQYAEALSSLKRAIDATAAEVGELAKSRANLQTQYNDARLEADAAVARVRRLESEAQTLTAELSQLRRETQAAGVSDATTKQLSELLQRSLAGLGRVDSDRTTVLASAEAAQLPVLTKSAHEAEEHESRLSRTLTRLSTAEARVKAAQEDLKRHAASAVDDYLSSIEPMLQQLYARLRPHAEWGTVGYLIRGELRKFLSLVVGEDLNLRFMFSSGQRRAAGIAFLLAVSLARPWARLGTLILDDPVQHVDDFRALHLVETLAAIRQMRRQVICMVEDPQLAKLLARRLRASQLGEGRLIQLQYSPGLGVTVLKEQEIVPLQKALLRTA